MYGATLSKKPHNDYFSISASHYGYIHTKLRKSVVVAMFAQHYVAVPMYTHNGGGLDRKPDRGEFVPVTDARSCGGDGSDQGALVAERLSDHRILLAELQPGAARLYEKTAVHFVHPVSRRYGLRVTHVGELERESRERLIGLFREYMLRGTA